jgi:hypothetical protein
VGLIVILSLNVPPVNAIPELNKLIVPYHNQFESNDPNSGEFCCVASVEMALEYISGQVIPQTTLAAEMGTSWGSGTYHDMAHLPFDHRNYTTKAMDHLTFQESFASLKAVNAMGYLSIIIMWFDVSHRSGHCVLVTGYNQTGIIVNDPWPRSKGQPHSRRTGMNTFIPQELFADLWAYKSNWMLQIPYPAHVNGFIIPTATVLVDAQLTATRFIEPILMVSILVTAIGLLHHYRSRLLTVLPSLIERKRTCIP